MRQQIKIGQKSFEFGLVEWSEGRALLSLRDEPAAVKSPSPPKIIGVRPDGKILRQFAPTVQSAAYDRRRPA
jgi:hypothetical protein